MSKFSTLLSWVALPIYAWQGIGVRRRTERMAPASGATSGLIDGRAPEIALLVLGDSSAASVGIALTDNGVAAQLAALTAEKTGQAVRWRAAGFSSAVSAEIRDHVLPNLASDAWTHIVVSIGTNDAKNFHSVPKFKKAFGGLLYGLRAKWPDARIVWSPVVDMKRVPALPSALASILEVRAVLINAMGERLCRERGAIAATRLPITDPQAGFSSDGFHASEAGYRAWAEHLLPFVLGDG